MIQPRGRTLPVALIALLLLPSADALAAKRKAKEKGPETPPAAEAPAPAAPEPAPVAAKEPPAPATPAKKDERIPVAIMEVSASPNVSAELAAALADVVPQELNDLGLFRTITRSDVAEMIKYEQRQQLLGCEESGCMNELGSALGADYLVSGSVTLLGELYVLQFRLIRTSASRVVQRVSREYRGNVAGLLGEMRLVAKMLVRDLTATHAGTLRLRVSEEGATVKVDGTIVGVTPMEDLAVAGGLHVVSVEKASFVLFAKDVVVAKNEVAEVEVTLVPSEEYRKSYVAAAERTRFWGWTSLGAGVLALGGAGLLFGAASDESAALSADVAAFNADPAGRTKEEEAVLNGRRRRLGLLESGSIGTGLLGLAGVVTGAVLLLTGDDPHRFDALAAPPPVAFGFAPDGAWAQLRF